MSSPVANKPIAVIRTAADRETVLPNSLLQLGVTVNNQGDRDAIVYISVDPRHPQLAQWIAIQEQRLALAPGKSGEVTFQFKVPADTSPGLYEYDLVVDASDYYTDYPAERYSRQQIQVTSPQRSQVEIQDSSFNLDLRTTPSQPKQVQPGEVISLQAIVSNRTERVDRFRLVCEGLPADWKVTITYPTEMRGTGLIQEAESLGLNPGDISRVPILIQSPAQELAGIYVPTFRLYSENQENYRVSQLFSPDDIHSEIILLDLLYLQVQPIYLLQGQINAIAPEVNPDSAKFEVQLANLGNSSRQVKLKIRNQDRTENCRYQLVKEEVALPPKSVTAIELLGKPQHWWKRPWFGPGQVFNFQVELEDAQQLAAVQPNQLPAYLTWKARPWWQLLLAILLALGMVGSLAGLIWWLFLRPPVVPKVLSFAAEDSRYAALNNDVAQVGWEIENPDRIKVLKITGYSPEGEVISGPLTYELEGKQLPAALEANCVVQEKLLTCRNIETDARRPGQYLFELALIPKHRQEAIVQQSKTVVIAPKPVSTVKALTVPKALYRELGSLPAALAQSAPPPVPANGLLVSWQVENPEDIKELKLIGRDAKGVSIGELRYPLSAEGNELQLPETLQKYCKVNKILVCTNVPTGVIQVGEYRFELQVVSRQTNVALTDKPVQTDPIQIQPLPFYVANFQINGQPAAAHYRIPLLPNQPAPKVFLGWQVRGGQTTKVELLPSPGQVPTQGMLELPINQQYGTSVVTLQVSDRTGQSTTRSVTFETYNPAPTDPTVAAANAAKQTAVAVNASNAALLKAMQAQTLQTQAAMQAQAKQSALPPPPPPGSTRPSGSSNAPTLAPGSSQSPSASPNEANPRFQ
ncbi:MAG: hypothetical protein VKJ24_15410 [Synechococcales bacterium]|nr:hypothetical protein [Synechococcales bacterium]